MTCIICRSEKQPSPEHVIPRALGGSFVIYRVCHQCNSKLGARAVDQGLIEHASAVERRIALQLAGNSGKVPDPVAEAIRRPIPTGIPNVNVRLARKGGAYHVHVERHTKVTLTEHPDGTTRLDLNFIVDGADEKDAEMYLKSALRKEGIHDDGLLDEICATVLPQLELRAGPTTIGVPVRKNEGGHHLGLTKIAYEMAHHWLGDAWLDDPVAHTMRSALLGHKSAGGMFKIGDGTTIERPRVTSDPTVRFEELPLGYDPVRTSLMALYPIENSLFVCVWLLDAFSAMFLVTENAAAYPQPEYDAVGMDVLVRRFEEFRSVMPSSARTGLRQPF